MADPQAGGDTTPRGDRAEPRPHTPLPDALQHVTPRGVGGRSVPDYTVVGGGVVGIAIARELATRGRSVAVLEKEPTLARHASGRNSGVLHAGFYYAPGSLKARLCRDGNRLLREFCFERGCPIVQDGKVVVARNRKEVDALYELERRGRVNDVDVRIIGRKELEALEPAAQTYEKALYSPHTAVVDPVRVCEALADDARSRGVEFFLDTAVSGLDRDHRVLLTSRGEVAFRHLINCAGAYADRIAHLFGVGREYRMLPFKGTYYELVPHRRGLVRSNIYPVPDLNTPFLGVHFTKTVDGRVIIGPTATPVFGREAYEGLFDTQRGDAWPIFTTEIALWVRNEARFRAIAWAELRRCIKPWFVREARQLVPAIRGEDMVPSSHLGIRAQLVNLREKTLASDFIVERTDHSTHVLNAVSPAFTCSLAFATYVVDRVVDPG